MSPTDKLTLYEQVFILSIRHGKVLIPGTSIGGVIIAELALRNFIAFESTLGDPFPITRYAVRVLKDEKVGDDLLDECFDRIHEEKEVRSAREWIKLIEGGRDKMKELKEFIGERLLQKLVLKPKKRPMCGAPGRERWVVKRAVLEEIARKLSLAGFTESGKHDAETSALIAVCFHMDVLRRMISVDEKWQRKAKEGWRYHYVCRAIRSELKPEHRGRKSFWLDLPA